MYKMPEMLTIREWGLRYGIKVIKPNGFRGTKQRVWNRTYTKRQFERGLRKSYITVNTEKGLAFIQAI